MLVKENISNMEPTSFENLGYLRKKSNINRANLKWEQNLITKRGIKLNQFKNTRYKRVETKNISSWDWRSVSNAINGMIEVGLQGVEFIAVNTDAQDLRLLLSK